MSTVSIQKELDAFKAAVVERNGFAANDIMTMRTALSVTLCGARGKYAAKINQRFVATEERLNGAPVFVGVDDSSQCLCIAAEGRWCVQPVEEKGQNSGCAYVKDKSSPLDPAVQWEVACGQNAYIDIGCGRVEQVRSSFQTFQEQSVSTQQDIRDAASVTLCGAIREYADKINQQFVATEERLNGAPVFVGVDDSSQCLSIAADGNWCVQSVEEKGQNRGCATVNDEGAAMSLRHHHYWGTTGKLYCGRKIPDSGSDGSCGVVPPLQLWFEYEKQLQCPSCKRSPMSCTIAYVKDKISPLDPAAQWMVFDNKGFEDQSVRVMDLLKYDLQGCHDWKEVACSHTGSLQHSLAAVPPLFCLTACCISTGFAARGAEAIGLCQLLLQSFMCESILLPTE